MNISVGYSQRYLCLGCLALDDKVCFRALRSLKKYDPGAQCGIEYYIIYCKFARMQKCEFLIFGIFVVQGKKMPIRVINLYTVIRAPEIIIELYIICY